MSSAHPIFSYYRDLGAGKGVVDFRLVHTIIAVDHGFKIVGASSACMSGSGGGKGIIGVEVSIFWRGAGRMGILVSVSGVYRPDLTTYRDRRRHGSWPLRAFPLADLV